MSDVVTYAATLGRLPDGAAARPLLVAPAPGVTSAVLDEGLGVATLWVEPGVPASAFEPLGSAVESPAVPSAGHGPLPALLYPPAPAAVAVYGDPDVVAVTVRWPASVPVADVGIDPDTGDVRVLRRRVGRGTTRLAADVLGGTWRDMRTGYAWLHVEQPMPDGGSWFAALCFHEDVLVHVGIAHAAAGEPRDWGSVTLEGEYAKQVEYAAWLERQLGPGTSGDDHSWVVRLPWGVAYASYVPRDGATSMAVEYGH